MKTNATFHAVLASLALACTAQGDAVLSTSLSTWGTGSIPTVALTDYDTASPVAQLDWLAFASNGDPIRKDNHRTDRITFAKTGGVWNDSEKKYFAKLGWTDGTPTASASTYQQGWLVKDTSSGSASFTIENIGGTATTPWTLRLWGYKRSKTATYTVQIVDMVTGLPVTLEGGGTSLTIDTTGTVAGFQRTFTFAPDPANANPQKLVVSCSISSVSGSYARFGFSAASLAGTPPPPGTVVLLR